MNTLRIEGLRVSNPTLWDDTSQRAELVRQLLQINIEYIQSDVFSVNEYKTRCLMVVHRFAM